MLVLGEQSVHVGHGALNACGVLTTGDVVHVHNFLLEGCVRVPHLGGLFVQAHVKVWAHLATQRAEGSFHTLGREQVKRAVAQPLAKNLAVLLRLTLLADSLFTIGNLGSGLVRLRLGLHEVDGLRRLGPEHQLRTTQQ